MKNFFKIWGLTFAIFVLTFTDCQAAPELIEATGSYTMDLKVDETFATATARAREEAKRAAAEKAGVYVQSYTKIINLELDYDEVKTVAASLLKIQDEKIGEPKSHGDGLLEITVTIKALVEIQNEETLKNMMSDKQNLEEAAERYKKLQEEYDALKIQMEQLKQDYNSAGESKKSEIKKSIAQNNKYFEAFLALEEGNNAYFGKNFQQAISAYSRAIEMNPNYAEAYNNRGNAYGQIKNFQQAIQDYQNALKFNKVDSRIYANLGNIYLMQKNYSAAINEYTQSINLNPNLATTYYNRALAYCYLNQFKNALPDAQRAMALNPSDNDAKKLYDQIIRRVK